MTYESLSTTPPSMASAALNSSTRVCPPPAWMWHDVLVEQITLGEKIIRTIEDSGR